ncbi:MAG TPA: hypothetical protein VH913_16880 [Hyphomicrobiaceae bacterium]|jgi:hypothetical protein
MTQATNGFIHEALIEQQAQSDHAQDSVSRLPMRTPEEVADKLSGIAGALTFCAAGCRDDSGPNLWEALTYLSNELSDLSEVVAALLQARGA